MTETAAPARRRPALAAGLSAVSVLAGCTGPQDMLDPRGPAAARVETLWWVFLVMAVVVTVGVAILLLLAIRSSRARAQGSEPPEIDGRRLVWIAAGVITPLILFGLLVYNYRVGSEVYGAGGPDPALTVEVVGHQFWWEVRYPEHGLVAANEVRIPAGQPVRFLLRAHDVIHSFWVPQLHGKTDMIPGHTTELRVQADEPGAFRGQCAEYCGMSHALMALWVIAVPPSEFEAWVAERRRPRADPDADAVRRGREVFFAADCGKCHATRGWPVPPEVGDVGPDLTHLASRRTLAAGTLPNTRGSLGGWIADPQRIKPGARMPGTRLPSEQMHALLTYLETLR